MIQDYQLIKTLPVQNELGEGVFWDVHSRSIWWTDILRVFIYQYVFDSDRLHRYSTPEPVASFSITNQPGTLICAFASGIALYQLDSGKTSWLYRPALADDMRLNDGKTDRQGRFWAGSMHMHGVPKQKSASLYCLDKGRSSGALSNLHVSNGLCWSPDSLWLYHADSPTRRIMRYPFDAESGRVGNGQVFAELSPGQYPDGATVDANGNLYSALWDGACVRKFSPRGEHLYDVVLPVTRPTCVAFVGDTLNYLAVTSARQDLNQEQLSQQPEAGNLFIFACKERGIADIAYNI